ncbi:hypothetical protein BT96DRAFT_943519 [Gymnopus androsaceus JB14]|uniref:CxC2-like cysteine cluster KDZ transposase-associated domain-containing protein n=1 Tax=Gymnopus androsaceus JB14 TaxID=1447944 RepID=A0A6A4H826_9AGAR|nr:hypothetical protein BT96DRAFT_943519 [Gymnopus androsaceus JB14]
MKYKKFKTLSARVSTNDHSKSEDEEPFHKPERPKKPVHYSHINISTSTSSNSRTSHHSTNFNDSGDSEEEEPIIEPTPTSFMPLQDTPLLIRTSIATTLSLVSYSFQDFGQKASKPLAGEEIDADEEDSFRCNKDGSRNDEANFLPVHSVVVVVILSLIIHIVVAIVIRRNFTVKIVWLEQWNGQFFVRRTLKDCGLILELGGYTKEKPCLMVSIASLGTLNVVDKSGIQNIMVQYCTCHLADTHCQQLLCAQLWPATISNPKTAVSFDCLEHFQMLNLMTKTSSSEFYKTLERLTDNTGMNVPPSHLREFMRASRQWRTLHLQTVHCSRYENKVHQVEYFLRGAGSNFMAHVNEFDKKLPPTKPTCNDHKAIHESNSRSTCNLCYGKRQINLDYIWCRSMMYKTPKLITSGYDVMCHWSVCLFNHLKMYPVPFHPTQPCSAFQLLVPKFHLNAHIEQCQNIFSFNWVPGVSQTDTEGPECAWAVSNSLAGSTKKMGPGSHWDMLDEHFGDWNCTHSLSVASYLLDRAEEALENRPIQVEALKYLTKGIKPDCRHCIPKVRSATGHHVRLELALEEEERTRKDFGKKAIEVTVSVTTLIAEGLDLKEVIQHFKWDSKHQSLHLTDLQKAQLLDRGFSILSRMDAFFKAQQLHIPHAVVLHDQLNSQPGNSALWNIPLLLPSEIVDLGGACSKALLDIKWRLQYAYCHDSLEQMQKHLLVHTGLIAYKLKYLHGQYNGTKSNQTVNVISTKIDACAAKYRMLFAMVDKHAKAYAMGVNCKDNKAIHDSLRISWCKASARAHQWQEECLLIQEEMQWSLLTFEKQALQWEKCAADSLNAQFHDMVPEVIEGCSAYAAHQIAMRRNLAVFCQSKWVKVLQELAAGSRGIAMGELEYILA